MNFFEQIAEIAELIAVKEAVISFVNERNQALKEMFEEIGVQVDIKVDVKVEGVDLQTFRAGFKNRKGGGS